MRVTKSPDPVHWEYQYTCDCGTGIVLDQDDIQMDMCKKPGTYWFTGSADAAGLDPCFFSKNSAACPTCKKVCPIPENRIPRTLRQKLARERQVRQ